MSTKIRGVRSEHKHVSNVLIEQTVLIMDGHGLSVTITRPSPNHSATPCERLLLTRAEAIRLAHRLLEWSQGVAEYIDE
jgi:hypothetical protein